MSVGSSATDSLDGCQSDVRRKKTLGTGKMPVPQESLFVVEQASCLFLIAITYKDSKADRNLCQSGLGASHICKNTSSGSFLLPLSSCLLP
ncbi:MAG TPA: hypothetical protein VLA84_07425 [Microcoleus sp.]|nr:hypothetical protein [Microcoleus sp.]